jgi:hypothetical protein
MLETARIVLAMAQLVLVGILYLLEKKTGIPFITNGKILFPIVCIWLVVTFIIISRADQDDIEYAEREEKKKKYGEMLTDCNEALRLEPTEKEHYKKRAEVYRLLAQVEMLPDKENFYLRRADENDAMVKKLGGSDR